MRREQLVCSRRCIGWFLFAVASATACAVEEADVSPELEAVHAWGARPEPRPKEDPGAPAPRYLDAGVYFQDPAEVDAWYALLTRLRADFDDICGDTFCEGDFSNYESLRFRCSVEAATGGVGRCVWVFAASNEEITPATGALSVDGQVFPCKMEIDGGTDIRAVVAALSAPGRRPIRAPLPGGGRSLYDALTECL